MTFAGTLPLAGVLHYAAALAPIAGGYHIEVLMRVDPDPVAGTVFDVAPLGQPIAFQIQYANHPAVVFRDVDDVFIGRRTSTPDR